MDKRKLIEEMAQIINKTDCAGESGQYLTECIEKGIPFSQINTQLFINTKQAEALYNAGYRKIRENELVVEKSAWESPEIKNYRDVIYEQARKEISGKIAEELKALFPISEDVFRFATPENIQKAVDDVCKRVAGGQYVNTTTLMELSTDKTPLTVEQLKSLPIGAWICVDALQDTKYETAGVRYWKKTPQVKLIPDEFQCGSIGYGTAYNLKDYGATWLAYLPEKQPKNIDFSRFYELVGLPKGENS
ncbi:MAG: hypothetical protein IJX81_01150 [Clostridia bacterium]|nr:hypothetical protein [Clostridia bacterium]